MGKNGKVDCRGMEGFQKDLEKLEKQRQQFAEACAKELAARLLQKVIKRTPVGQYPEESGKKGGTLRRGWTAGKRSSAKGYADSLKVQHTGDKYVIEVINPVEYAAYVEYGHRTRSHTNWVNGKFMLSISEQEL